VSTDYPFPECGSSKKLPEYKPSPLSCLHTKSSFKMMIQISWGMKPCKLVNNGVSQDVVAFIFRVGIDLSEENISSCVKKTKRLPLATPFFF
jgi:hypothetical protein